MKLNVKDSNNKVCHISFDKAIVDYPNEATDVYVSTLKNCTNITLNLLESSTVLEIDEDSLYPTLLKLNKFGYKYAVLWAEGSWPTDDIDKCIEESFDSNNDWLVAGYILNFKNRGPKFHVQWVIVNLEEFKKIFWLSKSDILKKKFTVSEENFHDDYTPHWIKPANGNDGIIKARNIFDKLLWLSLKEGYTVLNIDYDIRSRKVCVYPEDDVEWTQTYANKKFWTLLSDEQRDEFFYQLKTKYPDKKPLFEFLNLQNEMVYITNTETVPDDRNDNIEVLVCPASGLSQFKHISNNLNTMQQVIWTDFSNTQMNWLKNLIFNWDGKNFKEFYKNNKPANVSIIYDEEKVDDFFNSFETQQNWLETWNKIKTLDHKFLVIDLINKYNDVVDTIDANKTVFLQVSNIWSYEVNYFDNGINVHFALIDYVHKLQNKSKKLYLSGDIAGYYKDMIDMGRRTWL